MNNLKLNKRNTFLIGLAFFATLMLWQIYNNYCPLILDLLLKSKYGADYDTEFIVGVIMAMDNVVALILMPIIGMLSDKTKSRFGKRMPYILVGMLLTGVVFPFIAVAFILNSLTGVIIFMALVLVIMTCYRNPVVALMPDVTPKPLRSLANGIINLVGYIGAILAAVMGMIWSFKGDNGEIILSRGQEVAIYPFAITSAFILVLMVILGIRINENKLVADALASITEGEKKADTFTNVETTKLSKKDKANLFVLLGSVFLWFMAFNAVETFNSTFTTKILGSSGIASTGVMILTGASILTFMLLSPLASKIGRKMVVIIGLIALIFGFGVIAIGTYAFPGGILTVLMYVSCAILGFGWALININSYPMVVELSNKGNVGKFTGYYYIGSMLAQSITPILLGLIIKLTNSGTNGTNNNNIKFLYPYACIFAIGALILFLFVKSRFVKGKIQTKKGIEALGDPEDN
ncbi:MAG: MFS transporter [Acholeplasmatales bacterium]|jgi:Na+/melibiose symporter-like transporter|nr:MFS transporter [Acholeplasmatales bacterium]